jgi:hypothetical protein
MLEISIVRERLTELKWCVYKGYERWLTYIEDYCIMSDGRVSEPFPASAFRVKEEGSSFLGSVGN